MRLASAVRRSVRELGPVDLDKAAVELAIAYARAIDAAGDEGRAEQLAALGPKLLAALESLQLSPRARAQVVRGGARAAGPAGPLDQLRQRRAARVGDTATVDAGAT